MDSYRVVSLQALSSADRDDAWIYSAVATRSTNPFIRGRMSHLNGFGTLFNEDKTLVSFYCSALLV